MDPALREYLDSMCSGMPTNWRTIDTHLDAILDKQEAVADQLEYQSSHLDALCEWKPDLDT
jgi:hypothetical protein